MGCWQSREDSEYEPETEKLVDAPDIENASPRRRSDGSYKRPKNCECGREDVRDFCPDGKKRGLMFTCQWCCYMYIGCSVK